MHIEGDAILLRVFIGEADKLGHKALFDAIVEEARAAGLAGATVLRGRRDRFAFGAVVSGFGLIMLLHLANPTAHAARSHLDRAVPRWR